MNEWVEKDTEVDNTLLIWTEPIYLCIYRYIYVYTSWAALPYSFVTLSQFLIEFRCNVTANILCFFLFFFYSFQKSGHHRIHSLYKNLYVLKVRLMAPIWVVITTFWISNWRFYDEKWIFNMKYEGGSLRSSLKSKVSKRTRESNTWNSKLLVLTISAFDTWYTHNQSRLLDGPHYGSIVFLLYFVLKNKTITL